MAALGALIAWFAAVTLLAALVRGLIEYPLLALAMAVIGLLTWAYAAWTRPEEEPPPKPAERPQTAPWRIQASHVPESWGEPNGRWIVVPDQGPFLEDYGIPGDEIDLISEYVENVKRAHRIGGRKPKPTKRKPIGYRVVVKPVRSRPVDPESVPPSHPMRVWFKQAGLPWPPS
jgi:hypothetical protein